MSIGYPVRHYKTDNKMNSTQKFSPPLPNLYTHINKVHQPRKQLTHFVLLKLRNIENQRSVCFEVGEVLHDPLRIPAAEGEIE